MEAPVCALVDAMFRLPGKLDALLVRHGHMLPRGAADEISLIKQDLEKMVAILQEHDESGAQDHAMMVMCLTKEVRELSYDMEDSVDQYEHAASTRRWTLSPRCRKYKITCRRGKTVWRLPEKLKWRLWMANKIREFSVRSQEALQRYSLFDHPGGNGISSSIASTSTRCDPSFGSWHPTPYGEPVGIDAPLKKLESWLDKNGEQKLKVVSVVGSGGVGKTTLANELYRRIGGQFECRAFVRTSRKPDIRRLLISMHSQVQPHQTPYTWKVHRLISDIRTHLQDKRYLILIDDIWDTQTWDIINRALPDGNLYSGILVTTEVKDVALKCCGYDSKYVFTMKPLGHDDSRKLFFNTTFGPKYECPSELSEVANSIIRKCAGLPLATVIVANLLVCQTGKPEHWDYVNNSLGYGLRTNLNSEGMKQVLNLSYNSLPEHLKACVMYLSIYEEDYIIQMDDMVKQWVAEGFIPAAEVKDKEEISRSYFDDLISSRMIQPVHVNDNDDVLSFIVHYMVLDLVTQKSIEENFVTTIDHCQTTARIADKVRRLSLHFGNAEATSPTNMGLSQVRTLAFFGVFKCLPSIMEFGILQVLILHLWGDDESINFDFTRICELFRLRYLHITSNVTLEVQGTQMQGLQYLETLKIDARISAVPSDIVHLPSLLNLSLPVKTNLPNGIGNRTSLRTLEYFDVSVNSTENMQSLGDLTNLWDLRLTCSTVPSCYLKSKMDIMGSIFMKLCNLRSLTLVPSSISNVGSSSMSISCDGWSSVSNAPVSLQRFEWLPQICTFSTLPKWIGHLDKLCILKIGVTELARYDVVVLRGLPALTVLSLYVRTKPAEKIVFNKTGFLVLKYFKFTCSVPWVEFETDAMPDLRKLKLGFDAHGADQHITIPIGIEHLSGLKEVSAKIGGAGADDPDRSAAESVLSYAIKMHPAHPTFNIQHVDWMFTGTDDYNSSLQEEECMILPKKYEVMEEDSNEQHVLQKDSREGANKNVHGRAAKGMNQPRIAFATKSEVDHLDDGSHLAQNSDAHVNHPGLMENFSPRTLLNSISDLSVLTSDGSTARPKPIQKYCQNVCYISSIVSPLIEDICKSPEEQLNEVLRELDTAINEASGIIGNWHQTTSKIYFVWQIESVISDIQGCSLQLCQLANSVLPSLTGCACICIQKLEDINYEHMFDLAKEVAVELTGQGTESPANLSVVSSSLSLSTNLELYMEAVSLENLRARAMRSDNRKELDLVEQMIPMVNYLHERLLRETQLLNINGVPIPADFCCPLSLELMSDPVILASGQTYERVYIKLWLDEGFTICPKTRQRLAHSNLILNYNVKALISNWCESHDIKLPDPVKSLKLNFPSAVFRQDLTATGNSPLHPSIVGRGNVRGSPEADLYMRRLNRASPPHSVVGQNSDAHVNRPGHEVSTNQSLDYANGSVSDIARLSLGSSEAREFSLEERHAGSNVQTSEQSREEAFQASHLNSDSQDHLGKSFANGSLPNSGQLDGEGDIGNGMVRVSSDRTNYSSDASGEVADGGPSASAAPRRENVILPRLGMRGQFVRPQASDREFPRISSSSMDARGDLSAIENQVRKLIDDLRSNIEGQRSATSELRLLAKHNMENRIVIANCGAINLLVGLLHSPDAKIQENAVTALLNLSINDNNKIAIANADAVDPLIHALETGNPEAKENAAATLFSLSVIEENKVRIGRSGAVKPLVDLLGNGTPRGKKDAATALFNLSILHENKGRIVQADAVRHLVDLMDPAAGMVDKAVAVLANLATIPAGRTAIGQARGIPALVEVVELGSARGKENAAAALLQLCTNSNRFCSIVLQEGAVPHLVALSQSGTRRAREKAQALLSYFRSQRHGSSARR